MSEKTANHNLFLRLRGIPFSANEKDIREFLTGSKVKNVHFLNNSDGRPSGECYCEFETEDDVAIAKKKDQEMMGKRYIELFKVGEVELSTILKRLKDQSRVTGKNGFVRIRGLPFSCKQKDIEDFFKGLKVEEVVFGKEPGERGRPTGEAYVCFSTKEEAGKALRLDGQHIGHRYLEIYNSDENGFFLFKKHVNNFPIRDFGNAFSSEPYGAPYGGHSSGGFPFYPEYKPDIYENRYPYGEGGVGGRMPLRGSHLRGGPVRGNSLGYRFNPYDYHGRPQPLPLSDLYDRRGPDIYERGGYGDDRNYSLKLYNSIGSAGYGDRYAGAYAKEDFGFRGQPVGYDPYYFAATNANSHEDQVERRVHMRGIPFRVTGKQIEEFFAPLRCVDIRVGFFEDGRSTGDGMVEFASRNDAQEALKRDHERIGSRYIELFSQREVQTSKSLKIPHGAYYKTIGGRNMTTNNYEWSPNYWVKKEYQ